MSYFRMCIQGTLEVAWRQNDGKVSGANLGRALMTQGKEEEAEVEFRKAAEIERAAGDR